MAIIDGLMGLGNPFSSLANTCNNQQALENLYNQQALQNTYNQRNTVAALVDEFKQYQAYQQNTIIYDYIKQGLLEPPLVKLPTPTNVAWLDRQIDSVRVRL